MMLTSSPILPTPVTLALSKDFDTGAIQVIKLQNPGVAREIFNHIRIILGFTFEAINERKLWKEEWERKYNAWTQPDLVLSLRMQFAMNVVGEIVFAFSNLLGCSNPGAENSGLCVDSVFIRNLRVGFAAFPFLGYLIISSYPSKNPRPVRLLVECLRSLATM
ncbi:hypothetical protein HDU97_005075 [Phlyctochytrium planicorne]|nr:hypothetical protein HDU97_005075 [Phlyctochytrium planicorne]